MIRNPLNTSSNEKNTIIHNGCYLFAFSTKLYKSPKKQSKTPQAAVNLQPGFTDVSSFSFSQGETGVNNVRALQAALDKEGTIIISKPGIYKVSGTAFIGNNTSLIFGNGVVIQKSAEKGSFCHVFLNKEAGNLTLVANESPGKEIFLKTTGSMQVVKDFSATVDPGPGKIYVESDLTGLKK